MSLLGRLLRRDQPEQRAGTLGASVGFSSGFGVTAAGATITPVMAEQVSAVCACVQAIAGGIATLPARIYRVEGDGRTEIFNHPVARLIRSLNRLRKIG